MEELADRELDRFQWRTQEGKFLPPREMTTRHLFYTGLMIWNHSCPLELEYWKVHKKPLRYRFGEFYTQEYMLQAARAIFAELSKRADLTSAQARALEELKMLFERRYYQRLPVE
jgi:hypothetical protein